MSRTLILTMEIKKTHEILPHLIEMEQHMNIRKTVKKDVFVCRSARFFDTLLIALKRYMFPKWKQDPHRMYRTQKNDGLFYGFIIGFHLFQQILMSAHRHIQNTRNICN